MGQVTIRRALILAFAFAMVAALAIPALAQDSRREVGSSGWVAPREPTQLWSGAEREAPAFGTAAAGLPLQVAGPVGGSRIFVFNPMTQNIAWVDAAAVEPIAEPGEQELSDVLASLRAAEAAASFSPWWAMTHTPAQAWSGPGPDASVVGQIPQWRYLEVIKPAEGERVPTIDPRTRAQAWVDVDRIGPVGPPPEIYFGDPPPDTAAIGLPGRIVGGPDVYEVPVREPFFSLDELRHNDSVTAEGRVDAENGSSWYRIGDRRYVLSNSVRLPRDPGRHWDGLWIDADLREPVLVTAYEGTRPIYSALAVKGTATFQTRTGVHRIWRRVANETMDSATLGIPRNSRDGYYLRDVLFTQYFTGDGAALHYNYWRSNWGYAGSHGCLGMNYDDSKFFWDFAGIGTIVYVHN
jgi:hypothetical protein